MCCYVPFYAQQRLCGPEASANQSPLRRLSCAKGRSKEGKKRPKVKTSEAVENAFHTNATEGISSLYAVAR